MRLELPWYQNQKRTPPGKAKQNKTKQNKTKQKNPYRSISLRDIDAKIPNKILENQIKQYVKRIIPLVIIKLDLFLGGKDSSIYENQSLWYTTLTEWNKKNLMIISVEAEQAFDKI